MSWGAWFFILFVIYFFLLFPLTIAIFDYRDRYMERENLAMNIHPRILRRSRVTNI